MAQAAAEPATPAQKALLRTGGCQSIACRGCDAFTFDRVADGFRTCTCGHTQHAHRPGEVSK